MTTVCSVDCGSLFLRGRRRAIIIIGSRSLPFLHLDVIRRRKGDNRALDEGHECRRLWYKGGE